MQTQNRVRRWLAPVAAILLCLPLTAWGQATGQIQGRVVDAQTGDALKGAQVQLTTGDSRDTSDLQGAFFLSSVPTGSNTVEVRYFGYDLATVTVNVTAGGTTAIRVPLSSDIIELDDFTVTSEAVGQIRALNSQKSSLGVVNYISEESFGAVLDGNIGQAIQRIPGLSVDEDQAGSPGTINIRGVPGGFNSFQVDGNRMPNAGFSNAFNTRNIAADGVTLIEVIKAPTPDMDGDAVGGIINVVSRSAFQREGREQNIKVAGVLNEAPSNWGYSASYSFSDVFSVGDGQDNLGISFTLSAHQTDRYSENADQDWVQVTPEFHPELGLAQFGDRPVWFMESTHWEHDTRETQSYAIQGSIDYKVNEKTSLYFRPLISTYEREGTKFETDINIDREFDDEPGGNTYGLLTPTMGRGTEDSEGRLGWIGTDDKRENDLYSFATGMEWIGSDSKLNVDLFYSHNENDLVEDDEFNMEIQDTPFIWEYTIVDPEGDVRVEQAGDTIFDVTDVTLMSEGEWETNDEVQEDEVFSIAVDWEKEIALDSMNFTFKTGAKFRTSDQMYDRTLDKYETGDGTEFPYADVLVPTNEVLFLKPKIYNVDTAAGKRLFASNPDLFEFVDDDSLEDSNIEDFNASDEVTAAYVMGTFDFGRQSLVVGVRFEEFSWDGSNKEVGFLDVDPVSGDRELGAIITRNFGYSESYFLPGIHYRVELSENLIGRASYNRSYARPDLENLARGRFTDDDGNIEDGNPDLRPVEADNFDLTLEYYTQSGGLLSVGFFYKDLQDFHYTETFEFDGLDANGDPIILDSGDLEYERPLNGNDAENYGIELTIRQPLTFLPTPLDGLIFSGSATFTESEATYPNRSDRDGLPLEGFSDTIFTAALDYIWGDFRARVDYRYRSEYIEGLGSDIESDEFFDSEQRWDAEVAYELTEDLFVFVNVINITEEPQVSYQGFSQFVEDASFAGRKWTFGMEYSF